MIDPAHRLRACASQPEGMRHVARVAEIQGVPAVPHHEEEAGGQPVNEVGEEYALARPPAHAWSHDDRRQPCFPCAIHDELLGLHLALLIRDGERRGIGCVFRQAAAVARDAQHDRAAHIHEASHVSRLAGVQDGCRPVNVDLQMPLPRREGSHQSGKMVDAGCPRERLPEGGRVPDISRPGFDPGGHRCRRGAGAEEHANRRPTLPEQLDQM